MSEQDRSLTRASPSERPFNSPKSLSIDTSLIYDQLSITASLICVRANELQSLRYLQKHVSDNGERIRLKHLSEALLIGICSVRRANNLAVANVEEVQMKFREQETFLSRLESTPWWQRNGRNTNDRDMVNFQADSKEGC